MLHYLFITSLLLWRLDSVKSVRILEMRVPAYAAEGGEAILDCQFDMENELLYSVKWYKDEREFFRFTPDHEPPIRNFATPGVIVDKARSSKTVVTLIHLTRESTGLYSCEVAGDAPTFALVHEEKYITVYYMLEQMRNVKVKVIPESGPRLIGLQDKYNIGDLVRANCTSSASRPEAQLKWLINNKLVSNSFLRGPWYRTSLRSDRTETILELTFTIGSNHFRFDTMDIKCQATIAPLYQQETVHIAKLHEIPPMDSYTEEPKLGEQPMPTFPEFGDTSQLQLEDEEDQAASGSSSNSLLLLLIMLTQLNF